MSPKKKNNAPQIATVGDRYAPEPTNAISTQSFTLTTTQRKILLFRLCTWQAHVKWDWERLEASENITRQQLVSWIVARTESPTDTQIVSMLVHLAETNQTIV